MKEYKRWAKSIVEKALKTRRVIIISGARQVGKSTLTRQSIDSNAAFRTLDDTNLLSVALDDAVGFLNSGNSTLVIDEIQKAPLLLPEIKRIVDNNNQTGQFVLTGSADIKAIPEIKESLAGRVKNVRLRGLTQGEIIGTLPTFIDRAFAKSFPFQIKGASKEDILQLSLRGGYPEAVRLADTDRKDWHNDYVKALLFHDLKDIANIKRQDALQDILKIIASWSSKYMDIAGICSKIALSKPATTEYIGLIEKLYLCERLPAWVKTDYDRVGKMDKIYMTDTGLMSSILGWHYDLIHLDSYRYGKLIETFIFNELSAQVDLTSDYSLYHYRDRENHEIDFIIENEQGHLLGIEAKGGSHIGKEDFKHLKWFKEKIAKDRGFIGIVLYSGSDVLQFGEDMLAVPTACLWS